MLAFIPVIIGLVSKPTTAIAAATVPSGLTDSAYRGVRSFPPRHEAGKCRAESLADGNQSRSTPPVGAYVGRFGLIVLELHTLPPEITAANLESTLAIAYDGTHGYSDQYLVELSVFMDCAREAGLQAEVKFQGRFPVSELAHREHQFLYCIRGRPFESPGIARTCSSCRIALVLLFLRLDGQVRAETKEF